MSKDQANLEAALAYANRGWHVFPCQPSGKTPATTHGFKDATTDPKQIRTWWRKHPDFNVAIRTGAVSGIVVLDIDLDRGGDESLARLDDREWLYTVLAKTGGGGAHVYFAHPGGLVKSRVGLWPGIDVRGDGGYVVAPPSRHENGQPYFWITPPLDPILFPNLQAAVPAWLAEKMQAASVAPRRETTRQLRELEQTGVAFGMRNTTLARLVGRWYTQGFPLDKIVSKAFVWNELKEQPMTDKEVQQVIRNVTTLASLREPAEQRIGIIAKARGLSAQHTAVLFGLVWLWRRLGQSSLTLAAPFDLLTKYTTASRSTIPDALKALVTAKLITTTSAPSPTTRRPLTFVTFIGEVAAILEGEL